jgi:hypothetical protein
MRRKGARSMSQVIQIHAEAPAQPRWGEPCNGCGVCCLVRPCPVGIIISRRLSGPCEALRWVDAEKRYRCGVLGADEADTSGPASWWARSRTHIARRMIAAGEGCDCDIELAGD